MSKRHGRGPGKMCALCGRACLTWQECVTTQRARPPRDPNDYETIYDATKLCSPEQQQQDMARLANIYPFMTPKELFTAMILQSGAKVCAKVGGSAGSGRFSKFVINCRLRARNASVIPVDEDEDNEGTL